MPEQELELLTSPIERRVVNRLFVIGGPVGLAIAIVLSLWVSQQRVTHAVIVQAESQWVPGEHLAVRVQVTPESPQEPRETTVELAVEQGGQRHALETPKPVEPGYLVQGSFVVPSLSAGPATLHVHVEAPPFSPRDERIPVEIVEERKGVDARHVVSSSVSQYADDSEPQPKEHAIDLRPIGRVLAGFDNELLLRVTNVEGEPWSGPASMHVEDGEFDGKRGRAEDPPLVWEGRTDDAGLALVHGLLSSEVLRVRVRLKDDSDPTKTVAERMIRLVSFAGAVQLTATPVRAEPGGAVEVHAVGLSAKRPIFVDVFGSDGAWVETFDPPFEGREPPRSWVVPASQRGLVQLEAYHFTNAPGESTAVVRLQSETVDAGGSASLTLGVARQRDTLSIDRSDRTWNENRERGYLQALESRKTWSPGALDNARRWLLGTLPVEVYGPPTLLRSRERDLQAMADYKRAWTVGLRIFMLGGGGLFLLAMTVLMVRTHNRDAVATLEQLQGLNEGVERERLEAHVHQSRRAALLRGLLAVMMMAVGLASAMLLLENLVWEF